MACIGDSRGAYRVLVGRRKGKRPLEISRRRLESNIKMDVQEAGWGSMDWADLAHYSARYVVMNHRVQQNAGIS